MTDNQGKNEMESKPRFGTLAGTMVGITSVIAARKIVEADAKGGEDAKIERYANIIAETFLEAKLPETGDIIKDYIERRTAMDMASDAKAIEVISTMFADEVNTIQAKQVANVKQLVEDLPNDAIPFSILNAKARNFIDSIENWDRTSYSHKHMAANVTADKDYQDLLDEARANLVNAGILDENGGISDAYCETFRKDMHERWETQRAAIEQEEMARLNKFRRNGTVTFGDVDEAAVETIAEDAIEDVALLGATAELEAVLVDEEPEQEDFNAFVNAPAEVEDEAGDVVSDVLNEHDPDDTAAIIADLSEKVDIETIAETGIIDEVIAEAVEEVTETVDESVAAALLDNADTAELDENAAELVVEAVVAEKQLDEIDDDEALDEIEIVAPEQVIDDPVDAIEAKEQLDEGQALSFTQSFVAVSDDDVVADDSDDAEEGEERE